MSNVTGLLRKSPRPALTLRKKIRLGQRNRSGLKPRFHVLTAVNFAVKLLATDMFRHMLWLSGIDVSEKPVSYILKLKTMAAVLAEILVHMYQTVRHLIAEARHVNVLRFFWGGGF